MNIFNYSNDVSNHINHIGYIDAVRLLIDFVEKKEKIDFSDFIKEIKNKKVADIGSGFGLFQNFLREIINKDNKLLCIDPAYKDINWSIAKVLFNIKAKSDEIVIDKNKELDNHIHLLNNWLPDEKVIYKTELSGNEKIDIAFCSELFREIPDVFSFLENIINNLNKDGLFYIFDMNDPINSSNNSLNILFLNKLSEMGLVSFFQKEFDVNDIDFCATYMVEKKVFLDNYDLIKSCFYDLVKKPKILPPPAISLNKDYSKSQNMSLDELVESNNSMVNNYIESNYKDELYLSSKDFDNLKMEYYPYWKFPEGISYNLKIEIIENYDLIKKSFAYESGYFELSLFNGGLQYQESDYEEEKVQKNINNINLIKPIQNFEISGGDLLKLELPNGISEVFLEKILNELPNMKEAIDYSISSGDNINLDFESGELSWNY